MASFAPAGRKRTRASSPPDCSMEDFSNVATDGSTQQPSSMMQKTFPSTTLTAENLQASCAAVSPFLDFRGSNTLMLSQSSTASSVTFGSSVRMDWDSPQKQHRGGSIFDSVCFISDANNDNHSSVSMESPMRNCSMSLEPVRKKARGEGTFGGTPGGTVLDASVTKKTITQTTCCCHVCGNDAVDLGTTPKATPVTDSPFFPNNVTPVKPKIHTSNSLLNYFSKSKVSTKKLTAAEAKSYITAANSLHSKENSPISCNYCDKATCSSCTRPCERCSRDFCTFCSKVDYRGVVEKIMCFECVNEVEVEKNEESDVDMMDF